MIDIHSHVLWGIDDGSTSLEMSKAMLQLAWQQGTRTMVFTPHVIEEAYKPSWSVIKEKTQQLEKWLKQSLPDMQVYPAAEVQMNWNLLSELAVNGSYCINGGEYMLVELPMEEIPFYADNFWYELELKGIRPILAHPERYLRLMRHKELLLKWRERGLLLQCNSGSLVGYFGKQVQENALFLLQSDLIDFLGSDAHRDNLRTPDMIPAAQLIRERAGEERLQRITVDNPKLLLANKPIAISKPQINVVQKKKNFWQKILGKLV